MMSIMKNLEFMLFVIFASCLFSKSVDSKLQCYTTHVSHSCSDQLAWLKDDARFNCFKEAAIDEIEKNCPACSIGTITAETGEQFKWAFCDKGDYSCDHKKVHIDTDFYGKITKKIDCNICKKDLCNDLPKNKIKGKQKESKSRSAKKISSIVSVIVATALLTQL